MKKDNEKKINLGSNLTIDQIPSLKIKIENEFKNNHILILSSEEIKFIDLTGIQLLHHYISKAQITGKKLQLKIHLADEQKNMLEKNGFTNLLETAFK